jgi:hypothetical protein
VYSVSPASREALEELVATLRYVCMYVCVCVRASLQYVCLCVLQYMCVCVCCRHWCLPSCMHVCVHVCVVMYVSES